MLTSPKFHVNCEKKPMSTSGLSVPLIYLNVITDMISITFQYDINSGWLVTKITLFACIVCIQTLFNSLQNVRVKKNTTKIRSLYNDLQSSDMSHWMCHKVTQSSAIIKVESNTLDIIAYSLFKVWPIKSKNYCICIRNYDQLYYHKWLLAVPIVHFTTIHVAALHCKTLS